jgi:hypothetical protein
MYGLSNLKETVLSYIEKHAQDVFKTEGFHELSEETFCVLLASDNLNIDELNLIALVREWATVNSVRSNSNKNNNGNSDNNDSENNCNNNIAIRTKTTMVTAKTTAIAIAAKTIAITCGENNNSNNSKKRTTEMATEAKTRVTN